MFGDLSPNNLSCSTDAPCPVFGLSKNLSTPYVMNWNANLQQEVWRNAALTVAYVGNKGTRLYNIRDINQNIYAKDQGVIDEEFRMNRPFSHDFPHTEQHLPVGQRSGLDLSRTAGNPAAEQHQGPVFRCRLHLGACHRHIRQQSPVQHSKQLRSGIRAIQFGFGHSQPLHLCADL